MSFRFLYRRVPKNERVCTYCQEPIQRNIIRDKDKRIYHYGCFQTAKEKQYRCLECYLTFDWTEASFTEQQQCFNDEFQEKPKPICPSCGSSNIKPLGALD